MNAYTNRKLLFTNAEYQAAERELAHQYESDPTREAPELEDDDHECTDDILPPAFPPLSCQCGAMSIQGVTAEEMTKEWVAMDFRDHHMGRPCGTKLVTL